MTWHLANEETAPREGRCHTCSRWVQQRPPEVSMSSWTETPRGGGAVADEIRRGPESGYAGSATLRLRARV